MQYDDRIASRLQTSTICMMAEIFKMADIFPRNPDDRHFLSFCHQSPSLNLATMVTWNHGSKLLYVYLGILFQGKDVPQELHLAFEQYILK